MSNYKVIDVVCPEIIEVSTGKSVLATTSLHYAEFLRRKLESGERTLCYILDSESLDVEYFDELRALSY
jgi:hypothetical protein